MLNQRYAAIDQGTTGTRVVVFGEDGNYFSPAAIAHKQLTPNQGWVEHDPMEILNNIRTCLGLAGVVDAIGLAHQGESIVAWDAKSGLPLYNAIIWQDQRTDFVIRQLREKGVEEVVRAKTGLPLDTYFSASKMGWIMRNVAGASELSRSGHLRLGTMDAFFMFHLCGGVHVTDYNSASRTSLFNIHTLQWDEELCRLFGVPLSALPEVRDNIGHFGDVRDNEGGHTPLTACIVDQFAGTYGHGCFQPGQMKITFGTGAFLQSITGTDVPDAQDSGLLPTLCWKLPDEKPVYGLDGGVYNAASAINWAGKLGLYSDLGEFSDFRDEPAIARGLAFVPALSGLGCPYWDRSAAGLWAGLSLETERKDLLQSILEGIAMRSAEVINSMDKIRPIGDTVSVDGGLSSNTYFKEFLATLIQKKIISPTNREMTAQGVALLARKGLGNTHPMKVKSRHTVTEPGQQDFSDYFIKYKDIISRSRNLRSE
ncbi:glycerol kinase [Salmonella enterica subsp. enterica serovar Newport]|nr:glycerol kinase [Salmonella enterica subsp. enterica serovar Newport]MJR82252.1 glycerol kinase [Salmonella enterica subsp. enterica serovar Newport]HAE2415203.1 glycerol kinase [Salmonella enterica subsp. enterica serovar Newport]